MGLDFLEKLEKMFGRGYCGSDDMNNPTWLSRSRTEMKWCLWPRRCYATGKILCFKLAYRSSRSFRAGDTDFINEYRWYDRHEFLLMRIKYGI